ncbi:MAG: glycine betaine/L-proline ABC transporter ATP-binding protein [Firmicutes bacterium]|nr:glycine betaine/L-proline ABC transporter ATP-binding protein [Bacillota bacterium]
MNENNKILKVENLTKMFGSKKLLAREMLKKGLSKNEVLKKTGVTVAVDNVSFEVRQGEIFVLIGLSGSGKSTVIRCLNMLQPPTSGKIYFEGDNIKNYSAKQLREFRRNKVSMVFQNFGLMSHRDVLSNAAYGLEIKGVSKKEREEKAMEIISMVGLSGWEGQSVLNLSGGMRQRVGIARALINNPDVLLMDEPFSALDPLVRREMQFELLSIQEKLNKTIVFITHDIDEAFKLGNNVAIMQDGKIIQTATPEEMMSNPSNSYVKEFTNSADKTHVYSVKNIMITPSCLAHSRNGAKNALKQMYDNGFSSVFVVGDKLRFVGILTLERALAVRNGELSFNDAVYTDVPTTQLETPVSDLIPIAAKSAFPIAVVDNDNRLKGLVTKAAVLASLS